MITKEDKLEVRKIQKFLESKIFLKNKGLELLCWSDISNSQFWEWYSLLDKLVSNLEKAPLSYKKDGFDKNSIPVRCEKCGWWGSSELLDGGGQIADTGDYSDTYCPVCGNFDLDDIEDKDFEITKQKSIEFTEWIGKYYFSYSKSIPIKQNEWGLIGGKGEIFTTEQLWKLKYGTEI